jgi:hypothetical protein
MIAKLASQHQLHQVAKPQAQVLSTERNERRVGKAQEMSRPKLMAPSINPTEESF